VDDQGLSRARCSVAKSVACTFVFSEFRAGSQTGTARFAWLTRGKVTSDGLKPHDDLLTEFPYLGPPNVYPA
jgi:hypothetical protein